MIIGEIICNSRIQLNDLEASWEGSYAVWFTEDNKREDFTGTAEQVTFFCKTLDNANICDYTLFKIIETK